MATPDQCNRQWIRSGILCCALSLILLSPAAAQLGRRDADAPGERLKNPAAPRYDLIALRVEFQPDDSRFSTGDGVFGGSLFADLQPRVDPFPHDDAYFEAHLSFLSNYVRKASIGQTVVDTHLLPGIVRVSGKMGDYAPIGPDADQPAQRHRLLALVREAWTLADQQIPFDQTGFDPNRTAFVIFHAGTGRDIELTGTVLDRTPEDLPSLFLGSGDLDDVDNTLTFKGLSVNNTVLIPETESKRGVDPLSNEPFLLELSVNGLMAASFFNFLGVPDLFDTSSGTSAIGPFGLMDPLGIFAYGGILPPEPSAWPRYYLGWTTPIDVSGPEPENLELRSHLDQALVPISSSEYFLVEVRHRDEQNDGLNLTVWKEGALVERHFEPDVQDFTPLDQSAFDGVLVDADDFDWALPGGFDDTGALRLGGVLIWHIDERVIADGLASNAVNAQSSYRGVDLEEADSAQDLGFASGNPFAPDFDRGTPFDFYFEGNPVTTITSGGQISLYANRFGPDTYPNSNSNGGGPSFVVLDDFSPVATTMSLRYQRAVDVVTPVDLSVHSLHVPFGRGASVSSMHFEIGPARVQNLLFHTGQDDQTLWLVNPDGKFPSRIDGVVTKPVVESLAFGADALAYLVRNDAGDVFFARLDPVLDRPDLLVPLPTEVRLAQPSTPLIGVVHGSQVEYYVGYDLGNAGYVVVIHSDQTAGLLPYAGGGVVSLTALPDGDVLVVGREKAQEWHEAAVAAEWTFPEALVGDIGQAVSGRDALGVIAAISSPDDGRVIILGSDERVVQVDVDPGSLSRWPIVLDSDGDGLLEVAVTSGNSLLAFSREGALVSGFPIRLPAASATQPLVATFDGDVRPDVILALTDGYLYAYRLGDRPQVRNGFPLPVGGNIPVTPVITDNYIYIASASGGLAGWRIEGMKGGDWTGLYGDGLNRSFVDAGTDPLPEDGTQALIIAGETYNWPNPVRDGVTKLRVATREPCVVDMKVIDLAGNLVHSFEADVHSAFVPVEFEWRPDVASGVYYARVSARAPSGRHDTKLYSIAVIR